MDDPVGQGPSQPSWLAGPLYWLAGLAGWLGWLGPLLGPLLDPFLGRFNRVFLRFGVQKGVKMGSPASPGPDWPEPVRTAQILLARWWYCSRACQDPLLTGTGEKGLI